jgi:hypothetical protein
MKIYARICEGCVAELFTTDEEISTLFHPSVKWLDVTGQPPQVGWLQQQDGSFAAPPTAPSVVEVPTITKLQAQLAALAAQIAALQAHN